MISFGYTIGPRWFPKTGGRYLGAAPSKKSVQRIKTKVGDLLSPGEKGAWPKVAQRLNRLLGGWSAYFSHGSVAAAYSAVNNHVEDRVRNFLRRRHKTPGCGTRCFSGDRIFGELGVLRLQRRRGVSLT